MRVVSAALAGATIALVGYASYAMGAREARLAQYERKAQVLRMEVVRLDTVYQRDTAIFWRLQRVTDTLLVPDSIPVLAGDSARADSALRTAAEAVTACSAVVLTCEQRVAAERRLRVAAESALSVPKAPSLSAPAKVFTTGVVVGALGTAAAVILLRR